MMGNSSNKPLVTIGIPTYNRADGNLRKVIERSLGQSYENIEVVVSDNCSTDHTPELVQSITDPRLRYIRQQTNIGPTNNFNFCMNEARGEYFLLFHDDDMIDEDFVEYCMASVEPGQTVGTIHTGVRIIDEHNLVQEEHPNKAGGVSAADFIRSWYRGTTALYLCNTLYNTARLKDAGGFASKKNLFNDLMPTFTLATKYGRADVADIKASFRRHPGNRGSRFPVQDWTVDSLQLLDLVCDLLPGECPELKAEGQRYFCKKMYWYASRSTSVRQRLMDYMRSYKAFDYSISPLSYFYAKKIRRILGF